MAAKNLTTGEMVGVTQTWTTDEKLRPHFKKLDAAGLVRAIERAHTALVALAPAAGPSAQAKTLTDIHEKATAQDQRHDRKGRGAANLLDALADLTDDPAEAEHYTALRLQLFPSGDLSGLQASWRGEAGAAAQLQQRLDDDKEFVAGLRQIPAAGKSTLLGRVKELVAAGQRLGELEDERVRVQGVVGDQKGSGETQRPESTARNAWIRAVNALVTAVDSSDELAPEQRTELTSVYRDVEARADKRALARRAGASDDEGEEGEDGKGGGGSGGGATVVTPKA